MAKDDDTVCITLHRTINGHIPQQTVTYPQPTVNSNKQQAHPTIINHIPQRTVTTHNEQSDPTTNCQTSQPTVSYSKPIVTSQSQQSVATTVTFRPTCNNPLTHSHRKQSHTTYSRNLRSHNHNARSHPNVSILIPHPTVTSHGQQ